jgi:hypothetical protein
VHVGPTPFLQLSHLVAVATDLLALVAFVTIGLINHHGGLSATGYARDLLPIGACWLVAAGTFDLYRRPRLRALFATWLTGVTAGVAVRQLILWELHDDDVVFLAVALFFTLLFVLVLRTVASLVAAPRLEA